MEEDRADELSDNQCDEASNKHTANTREELGEQHAQNEEDARNAGGNGKCVGDGGLGVTLKSECQGCPKGEGKDEEATGRHPYVLLGLAG